MQMKSDFSRFSHKHNRLLLLIKSLPRRMKNYSCTYTYQNKNDTRLLTDIFNTCTPLTICTFSPPIDHGRTRSHVKKYKFRIS